MRFSAPLLAAASPLLASLLLASLLLVALALPAAAQAPGDVVINEILYDPPAPQPSTNEYVELLNRSSAPVDLAGLALADAADTTALPPEAPPLAPGSYVVLVRDEDAFNKAFPAVQNYVVVPGFPALNNSGDDLRLLTQAESTVLDFVPYRPSWGGADVALERISPDGPSTDPANFADSVDPGGGTPGQPNSVLVTDTEPPEIVSVSVEDDRTLRVTFSEPLAQFSPSRFAIEQADGAPGPAVTSLTLPPGVRDEVVLLLGSPLTGPQAYVLIATGISDEAGNVADETRAPFFFGDTAAPGDLVINEILYDPPAPQPSTNEYVEVLNRTDQTFDLSQLQLADNADTVAVAPGVVPLPPGAYAVLVRDADAFAAAFPDVPGGTVVVAVAGFPSLNNSGDTVRLLRKDGVQLDAVPYAPSWGGTDAALEKIDPAGPSTSPANFASSTDPRGGTPGEQNSVFAVDTAPPALDAADARDAVTVDALFTEPVDPATAGVAANYRIETAGGDAGPAVLTATPDPDDPARVVLALASPLGGPATFVLIATGIADLAGNVQPETRASFFFGEGDVPAPGDVVINEILYDPPAPQPSSNEYVELFNRSDKTFLLREFAYDDEDANPTQITTLPVALGPGGYAVLVRNLAAFQAAFPDVPPGAVVLEVDGFRSLSNAGDRPALLYQGPDPLATPVLIDAVPYRPSWGGEDAALERLDPAGPSTSAANFASSTDPRGGTPGERNSVFAPDQTPPEIADAAALSATEVAVRFSEPVQRDRALDPAAYQISAGIGQPIAVLAGPGALVDTVTLVLGGPLDGPQTYTVTATGLADAVGNVQPETGAAFFFGQGDAPAPGDVVINEILYDPPAPQPSGNEYVELFNRSDQTFLLDAFSLADGADTVRITTSPVLLAPGGYAVLVNDPDAFAAAFPDAPGAIVAVEGFPSLSNSGETVRLLFGVQDVDGQGTLTEIDAVPYEPSWGGEDASLERRDPDGPSTLAANFGTSTDPRGGTPGEQNSIFGRDSEVPLALFAEQRSETTVAVGFSEALDPASVVPAAFSVPNGPAVIAAVLEESGTVVILTLDGPVSGDEVVVAGVRDAFGNAVAETRLPLARLAPPGALVINEILFDPLADDQDGRLDGTEYVELFNTSALSVTLSDAAFTDAPDEDGDVSTVDFGRPGAVLAPGAYAVVYADPGTDTLAVDQYATAGRLARLYPGADLSAVLLLPVDRTTLSLANTEDTIRLLRADSVVVDSVTYRDTWHRPELRDPTGTALERIAPDGPSSRASNWTSSRDPSGGTPGRANSVGALGAEPPGAPGLDIASPFAPERGEVSRIAFTLRADAALVRARIYDVGGRLVRTLEDARFSGQTGQLDWDGTDGGGRALRVGVYVVLLEAIDQQGGTTEAHKGVVVLAR